MSPPYRVLCVLGTGDVLETRHALLSWAVYEWAAMRGEMWLTITDGDGVVLLHHTPTHLWARKVVLDGIHGCGMLAETSSVIDLLDASNHVGLLP